ncbi:uncharacterized protein [Medicago truncatula]|uniref:uncharacterized protein n=1 Tax=Medicago truncatula TaxID=3880 RepID=UPI001967547C|nr:uncharacterized protein LOC120580633 [Medicago truncatula]
MGDNDYSQCYDFGGGSSSKGAFNSTRNCEIIEDTNANNNPQQEQVVIEYNKIIGTNVNMELQGVKVLGTVISYEPSLNLFKVRYKDDDYPEEHIGLGVILDNMVQQIPEPSNISEKSGESKMLEGEQEKDASIGHNICKDFEDLHIKMDGNDNDKYFVNGVEVGSSLAGAINKITVETCGEKEDANRVQPSDNPEKDKSVPEPRKIIGCDIYKEFKGVKVLGTVINFMPSANLFEVLYKNDNRMEYLTLDEILKNMANKEDIWRVQQVSAPPPSNTAYMATETQMKKIVVAGETSTSKRRKGNFSIGAYSSRVGMDIEQPEVNPLEEDMNKEKSNSAQTYVCTLVIFIEINHCNIC